MPVVDDDWAIAAHWKMIAERGVLPSGHVDCTDMTCTCGVGPWDAKCQCANCGGFDLGMPSFSSVGV